MFACHGRVQGRYLPRQSSRKRVSQIWMPEFRLRERLSRTARWKVGHGEMTSAGPAQAAAAQLSGARGKLLRQECWSCYWRDAKAGMGQTGVLPSSTISETNLFQSALAELWLHRPPFSSAVRSPAWPNPTQCQLWSGVRRGQLASQQAHHGATPELRFCAQRQPAVSTAPVDETRSPTQPQMSCMSRKGHPRLHEGVKRVT